MKLYFAGDANQNDLLRNYIDKRLLSYWYNKSGKIIQLYSGSDVFVDSGGFSAFTKGVQIDIYKYIDFIKKFKSLISVYAVLDEIGNPKKTMQNLKIMEKENLSPIPVFHFLSDFGYLKEIVSEYKYIALGGLVPIAKDRRKMASWLDACFSIIKSKSKVHGFGMTSFYLMLKYPFYSVDSTSWITAAGMGKIYFFNGKELSVENTNEKQMASLAFVKCADNKGKNYFNRFVRNIIELKKAEDYVTKVWKKKGVFWDD